MTESHQIGERSLQLLLIPWSIFGATFATAAFPALAENIARNRLDRYRATIMGTLGDSKTPAIISVTQFAFKNDLSTKSRYEAEIHVPAYTTVAVTFTAN